MGNQATGSSSTNINLIPNLQNKRYYCKWLKHTSVWSEFAGNSASAWAGSLPFGFNYGASGLAVAGFLVKAGVDTAAIEANCDDVPFDEIKELLCKEFRQVDKKLDENLVATQRNLQAIYKNYRAIEHVSVMVGRTLKTVKSGFYDVTSRLSELKNLIEKLENRVREYRIKDRTLDLTNFILEFTKIMQESVAKLRTGDYSYQNYLKNAKTPHSTKTLYSLLSDILRDYNEIAVPKNADDQEAFTALFLLHAGTQTYLDMFNLVMIGFAYMALDNHHKGDVEEYNRNYVESVRKFEMFRSDLCGVGSHNGLISEVIHVFEVVKSLDFIKEDKRNVSRILSEEINYLSEAKDSIVKMTYLRSEPPVSVLGYAFVDSELKTPFLEWKNGAQVRYAVQHVHGGTYSQVGNWSASYSITDKACPKLELGEVASGTTRIIFRQFDQKRPLLVGVIENTNQMEFHDIDRDLLQAIMEGDKTLALENVMKLVKSGANVTAVFEDGNQPIHAGARAANAAVIRYLVNNTSVDINARDGRGFTALHIAVNSGNFKLAKDLIGLGADVRAATRSNWTALHLAAQKGFTKTLRVLIEGKRANLNAKATGGFTPLHVAVLSRKKRSIEELTEGGAEVNAQSDELITPLHLAVSDVDGEMTPMLLGKKECDVNVRAQGGLTALHLAAITGNVTKVEQLLGHKDVHVNAKSDDGWSPLHLAILYVNSDVTETLLNETRTDVCLDGKNKKTPMHLASSKGQRATVLNLIKRGVQLEPRDSHSYTPLHSAAEDGHLEIVSELVEKGATVEAEEEHGFTPLKLAVRNNNLNVVRFLADKSAELDKKNAYGLKSLFDDAVSTGSVDMVKFFEGKGAIVQREHLSKAASYGHWVLVKEIIFRKSTLVEGRTPLHNACALGNLDIVMNVFSNTADVNVKDASEDTALHDAVRSENVKIVEYLLANRANINAKGQLGMTALHLAARSGNLNMVEYLTKGGAEINVESDITTTPLTAAVLGNHLQIVKCLVGNGANVNPTAFLNTVMPLLTAAIIWTGNLEIVTYLLQKGADVNAEDKFKNTPLHRAVEDIEYFEIVKQLIKNGARTNAKTIFGDTPLHRATACFELAKYLVEHGSYMNAQNSDGDTPLHIASSFGHIEVARYLSEKCNCVNVKNASGQTPLYKAVTSENLEIVRLLVTNNSSVSSIAKNGQTPLLTAIRISNLDIVKCLTENGADVNATAKNGNTMLMEAIRTGNVGIIEYLMKNGAKCRENARCYNVTRNRRSIDAGQVQSRSYKEPRIVVGSSRDADAIIDSATSSWPLLNTRLSHIENRLIGLKYDVSQTGTGDRIGPVGEPSYSSSLNENVLLAKWLLHLSGRRSSVKVMNKVEGLAVAERQSNADWAERYLREGMERYVRRR